MKQVLPKEFRFSHEFAFFLHDILVNLIVGGEQAHIFDVKFKLKSQAHAKDLKTLSGAELWEWLEENNYREVVLELAYKQVAVSLLSDFCHFVYEAINCSKKAKLTVAFSLLRKPFKDNLFYLEWLLADPIDFLRKFHNEGPGSLELSDRKKGAVTIERRKEIIREAINNTNNPNWISPEFVHNLRYDRNAHYGLEATWNKATHLITTFPGYATGTQNFNFVFSNQDDFTDQWQHFYSSVPFLLYHAIEIVEALFSKFATFDKAQENLTYFRRTAGFLLWADSTYTAKDELYMEEFREVLNGMNLECPNCGKQIKFNKRNILSFYRYVRVKCGACRVTVCFEDDA